MSDTHSHGWSARLSAPGSATHLAVIRVSVALNCIWVLSSDVYEVGLSIGGHLPTAGSIIPFSVAQWLAAAVVPMALLVGVLASFLVVIGLWTRMSLMVLTTCFFVTQDFYFRVSLFHDDWLYFIVPLCLLCTAPCSDALSMDMRRGKRQAVHSQEYRWPVELCIAWFAVQYILAGLAKIVPFAKATQWFSGLLAQDFAMQFVMDAPMVEILGAPPIPYDVVWPFALISIVTVVVEVGAVVFLISDRFRFPMLAAIFGLHIGIWFMGIPGFVRIALVCSTFFFRPKWFADFAEPPSAITTPQKPN